jgi:hypothetical protein
MENQYRFDLNAAVENWRNQLAAQLQLTPDDRRELEKHLADSIAEFRGRGLNEEESFWLAQRRIGRPEKIAEEFEKANPGQVWRERAFWMVLALLAFSLWTSLVACVQLRHWITDFWVIYLWILAIYLPIIVFPIFLGWGRAVKMVTAFATLFKTRWHIAISVILFVVITHGWQALEAYRFRIQMDGGRLDGFWVNQFTSISFPLMLLAATIWLLPKQHQQLRMEKPA